MLCPESDFDMVTHIALEFMTQKNGVQGELVGLGRSGHPFLCPVHAALARLKHMHSHNAPLTTPLYHVFSHQPTHITTMELTLHLRQTCQVLCSSVGIMPQDISVQSIQSSGAMALLCTDVATDRIRLLGQWRSN
jgi:hypothetical protein